jgi:hypothetical protein
MLTAMTPDRSNSPSGGPSVVVRRRDRRDFILGSTMVGVRALQSLGHREVVGDSGRPARALDRLGRARDAL